MPLRYGLFILLITLSVGVSGCEGKSQQEEPSAEKPAMTEGSTEAEPAQVSPAALVAPEGSEGKAEIDEGITHYNQEHWDVAKKHFQNAVNTDQDLAEAHYNLALALDKLGSHGEATEHFKKALELAPEDPAIRDSEILNAHVGM